MELLKAISWKRQSNWWSMTTTTPTRNILAIICPQKDATNKLVWNCTIVRKDETFQYASKHNFDDFADCETNLLTFLAGLK